MLWRKRDDEVEDTFEEEDEEDFEKRIVDKLDDLEDMLDSLTTSMKKVIEATDAIKKQYEEMARKEEEHRAKIANLEHQLNVQNKFMQDLVLQLVNKPPSVPTQQESLKRGTSVEEYIKRKNGTHNGPRLP